MTQKQIQPEKLNKEDLKDVTGGSPFLPGQGVGFTDRRGNGNNPKA